MESSNSTKPGDAGTPECKSALVRLGIIAAVFIAAVMITYVIPGMDSLRPWVPGDDVPMKRLFTFDWSRGITGTGSSESDTVLKGDMAKAALAEGLGEMLAANLGAEVGIEQPGAPVKGSSGVADAGVLIGGDELQGVARPVEDPSGRALDAFFKSLYQTARGQKVTRIAHWGDSTIAADDVTGTLRRRFQARFGDSGHGFMLVGKGTMPYRHKDVGTVQEGQWKQQMVIRRERKDGRYGYGGVAFTTTAGGSAWYQTADDGPVGRGVTDFEVWYQRHPAGGEFTVKADGGVPNTVSTAGGSGGAPEDGFFEMKVDSGPHRFDLSTRGEVRLYGVVMENDVPGVVYDSLGIVGARAQRLHNFDPGHFSAQIAHRSPELLVIAFGGNECGDSQMDFGVYRENLKKTIALVRSGRPEASCMLVSPLDQGEVGPRGKVRTMPAIPRIVQTQREVAAEVGCAFFDTYAAMGGEGSMARWYNSRPRLGWGDYRHATPAGYEVIGNMIYKALLAGFADWLAREGLGGVAVSADGQKAPSP